MKDLMDISIVVVAFNEERNIGACLNSLVRQDYAYGYFEILVIDDGSSDQTPFIVKDFAQRYDFVHMKAELKKGVAAGRNAGIKASRYSYIAFIDADCYAPADWLAKLVEYFKKIQQKDQKLVAVGGANIAPPDSNRFVHAISVALDSYIGSFNSPQGRQFKKITYVQSLANLNVLYEKSRLEEIGCYDESLSSAAEDADMNFRLFSAGYHFVYIPSSFVWHKMRPTPLGWTRNMFRYGKERARLLKRYPKMWCLSFYLPLGFILCLFLMVSAPFYKIFYWAYFYFIFIILFSFFQSIRKKKPLLSFYVMFVFLLQHMGYATGELYGLLKRNIR